MAESEKDRIARQVADLRVAFDLALSDKRKYPVRELNAFMRSARRYIEITAGDSMIHKSVAQAVNGLREFLQVERKRIPGNVLFEADSDQFSVRVHFPNNPMPEDLAQELLHFPMYSVLFRQHRLLA
jgi:hypothetical protein